MELNGTSFDFNAPKKNKSEKNIKLEKIQQRLKDLQRESMLLGLTKYTKIFHKGDKSEINQVEENFVSDLKFLNTTLKQYDQTVKIINKSKKISMQKINNIEKTFGSLHDIVNNQITKIMFFKTFEMEQGDEEIFTGITNIVLNKDKLKQLSNKYGIKGPYTEIENKEEEIERLNKIKENILAGTYKEPIDGSTVWTEEKIEEKIDKELNKIEDLKKKLSNHPIMLILNVVNNSSIIGISKLKDLQKINHVKSIDNFMESEELRENFKDLGDIVTNLANIKGGLEQNQKALVKMKNNMKEQKLEENMPIEGSFQPVGPMMGV